jgi:glycosyltransferase involved in cell wall biosynthesis
MEVERDLRTADFVVVHGREDESFALEELGIEADRLFVVPCGIADEFHEPIPDFDPRNLARVLFLGSWIPRKGRDLLPGILDRILPSFPQLRVTLAGTGAGAEEVLQGFSSSAAARTTVIPRIENRDVPQLMSSHGTFLFPSRCEGFGLVVVEAMARGLVVVSSRVGVAAEVLADGVNGVLVDEISAEAFASALERVLGGAGEFGAVSRSARRTSESFSWHRSAETRVDLYRRFARRLGRTSAGLPDVPTA